MKFKFPLLYVALLLLPAFISLNAAAAETAGDKAGVHTVVKGDTLWDISEKYLGNPFLWPKLWQWNEYISNPHFIYPGDPVNLRPPSVMVRRPLKEEGLLELVEEEESVEAAAGEAATPEGSAEAKERAYSFPELRDSGFIDNDEMKMAGKIIDAEDEKIMLSVGDTLYLTLNDDGKVGDLYTIFKTGSEITHPVTRKSLGYKILVHGIAEITGVTEELATARVVKAFDAITRGDLIKPRDTLPEKITVRAAAAPLSGYIVAAREERTTFGERDIIYIDLGKKDGLERGNPLIVYKEGRTVTDRSAEKSYTLPSVTIGRLIVLAVKEGSSVAIITKSVEEMRVGEKIKSELN